MRPDDYRRSLDPFVALATAASVTDRILLGTGVVLAAQHDPIVLAKQIATLDHLSRGRVVFGTGFGWNRAEAADHGVEFDQRREVAREHVLCMQALWSQEEPEFHGEYVSLDRCWSWPKPLQQPRVPTLIGGGANPKVFAAVAEYADGWMPIGGSGLADALPALRHAVEQRRRDPDGVRVVPFGTIPTEQKLAHFERLGIDEVVLRVPSAAPPRCWPRWTATSSTWSVSGATMPERSDAAADPTTKPWSGGGRTWPPPSAGSRPSP